MRSALGLILAAIGLAACQRGSPQLPQIECETPPPAGAAMLCLRAVTVNLGPADEVEGYHFRPGLIILLLEAERAETEESEEDSPPAAFSVETLRDLELSLLHAGLTDNRGRLSLTAEPGEYLLCAVDRSLIENSKSVSRCEQVSLASEAPLGVMVRHTPRGDFLSLTMEDQ